MTLPQVWHKKAINSVMASKTFTTVGLTSGLNTMANSPLSRSLVPNGQRDVAPSAKLPVPVCLAPGGAMAQLLNIILNIIFMFL